MLLNRFSASASACDFYILFTDVDGPLEDLYRVKFRVDSRRR